MDKCYSPNWEGGMDVSDTHSFDKDGHCILCGEELVDDGSTENECEFIDRIRKESSNE